jgi:glycosyltransferase 2 family protein
MEKPTSRKYFTPLNLLYFVLGLGLLTILLLQIDFQNLLRSITSIPLTYLLLGGLIYLAKTLARSFRFWRINQRMKPSYLKMVRLTMASSLASQLLPLKLGELTYVYLVKKDFKTSVPQGLSALVVIRIFDLLAISLLFVLAALVFGLPAGASIYFSYVLAFMAALVLILLVMILAGDFLSKMLNLLVRRTVLHKIRLVVRLQEGIDNTLFEIRQYRGKEYAELLVYPLIEWGINFVMYHVLLLGMGLTPHFFDTVIGVAFAALASVLPINSFGNFGTQEAGWATGLILVGVSQDAALTSGFATHLLSLAYMLVMGGASWISYLFAYGMVPGSGSQRSDGRLPER